MVELSGWICLGCNIQDDLHNSPCPRALIVHPQDFGCVHDRLAQGETVTSRSNPADQGDEEHITSHHMLKLRRNNNERISTLNADIQKPGHIHFVKLQKRLYNQRLDFKQCKRQSHFVPQRRAKRRNAARRVGESSTNRMVHTMGVLTSFESFLESLLSASSAAPVLTASQCRLSPCFQLHLTSREVQTKLRSIFFVTALLFYQAQQSPNLHLDRANDAPFTTRP